MPKIHMFAKNEDAASVLAQRRRDALSRISTLNDIISELGDVPDPNRDAISRMDYLIQSLDNVIHDYRR